MKKNEISNQNHAYLISQINEYLCHQPQFSSRNLTRLLINQRPAGWLESHIAAELAHLAPCWHQLDGAIQLSGEALEHQLQFSADYLRFKNHILGWRNENYGVYAETKTGDIDFSLSFASLERASFRRFGFVSRAVHINAYYPDGTLCLGQRASNKGIDPNKLDNMTAGGIPINESIHDCLIRELAEEANVPANIAGQAKFINSLHVQRNEHDGTHREILYCFDLALPADFEPHNQDGEVARFHRMHTNEVVQHLAEMTWDAGRVTAEFLLRQTKQG